MNVEVANRLQQLRKKNNLSQEELAERIGISRQAVSKWERAEASPDTDNLILLSRLYGVSLDELLKTDSEILGDISLKKEDYGYTDDPVREKMPENYTDKEVYPGAADTEGNTSVPQGSPFGADVKEGIGGNIGDTIDKAGRAIGDMLNSAGKKINQEFTPEKAKDFESKLERGMEKLGQKFDKLGQKVDGMTGASSKGYDYIYYSGRTSAGKDGKNKPKRNAPPMTLMDKLFPIIMLGVFLFLAAIGLAHPGWVAFLMIPFYYTTKMAVRNKNLMQFCYPLACVIVYCGIGGMLDIVWRGLADFWYSIMWLLFLTIPLYYTGIAALRKRNPLIFCYPVLCVIIYIGFGIFFDGLGSRLGEFWFSVAWAPLALSIPVYYIVITHFRKKKNL